MEVKKIEEIIKTPAFIECVAKEMVRQLDCKGCMLSNLERIISGIRVNIIHVTVEEDTNDIENTVKKELQNYTKKIEYYFYL